jgi:hypothetical protein
MRRTLFLVFGILELTVAIVVAYLGYRLPASDEISQSFARAERVTHRAGKQVDLLSKQVSGLKQVQLTELSQRLQSQTRAVTNVLRVQAVDFDTVCTTRDALGAVSTGLNGLAQTLDTERMSRLGVALGETADFLSDRVVPAAAKAADHLDASTDSLRADAELLSKLMKETAPDFKVLKEMHTSLGHFRDGLGQMTRNLELRRAETMREGFRGLETSLASGADQVEKLAGYSYPSLTFQGLKPEVVQHPFWPAGTTIADGMRKAAAGATAAAEELDAISGEIPKVRQSLAESGKVIDKVRDAIGVALKFEGKVEPILKQMPTHASRVAQELPRLGSDLSRLLRDTGRLKEVATALRQAQKGVDEAVAGWPQTQATLSQLAVGLEAAHDQLDYVVRHRREYESAMQETVRLAETFVALLPIVTDQLEGRLDEEERTLSELGQSINEVDNALPVYSQTAATLLGAGRLLAWLVAIMVGLHASHLLLSVHLGRRYSL